MSNNKADNDIETEKTPNKKKERKISKPIPPPSVSTALVILRGTIAGITGCSIGNETAASLMQPSFVKDNEPTGKFSITLGKKNGTLCELDIGMEGDNGSKEKDNQIAESLLDSIEKAANRIIQQDLPIQRFQMTRDEAVSIYGNAMFDQSEQKPPKKKPETPPKIDLVFIEGLILAVPPGPTFSSTAHIKAIELQRGNYKSTVTAGKKARKCEIGIKFKVTDHDQSHSPSESVVEPVPFELVEPLLTTNIRLQEGHDFALVRKTEELKIKQIEEEEQKAKEASNKSDLEENPSQAKDEEMIVDPFNVQGKIDYNKLVDNFGSKVIEPSLLERMYELTVKRGTVPHLHRFLRRNIFFSHRDLELILDQVEKGLPIFLYTGRGPSSSAMHLGHLVPFLMTQWLQQAFQCPLVIQMTDDEKFLFKGEYNEKDGYNLHYFANLTIENAKDIIACGFIPEKTFIFSDLDYVGQMYPNICKIWKSVTTNTVNGIFGFDGSSNIGKIAFPAIQAAPSFASSFPVVLNVQNDPSKDNMACLIPCAIDQDPYFRMTRDVAHKLIRKQHEHPLRGKPALIHSKFFPPLQGAMGKMSSSDENSAIFLTDTHKDIEKKIKAHAFSGGQDTKELQMEKGANLDVDVSYQWLRFFMEDDEELERIGKEYGSGTGEYWSTGSVKAKLVEILKELVGAHQQRRKDITNEVVKEWMKERCLV